MRITDCSSDEVRIHFMVEQDSSRTWILSFQDDALRLAHDHRYPDGREYEANFYGGIAMDNTNQAFAHYPEGKRASTSQLFFPADPQNPFPTAPPAKSMYGPRHLITRLKHTTTASTFAVNSGTKPSSTCRLPVHSEAAGYGDCKNYSYYGR